MQQALTVASPALTASLSQSVPASSAIGDASTTTATFGSDLARLLAMATRPEQTAAVTGTKTLAQPAAPAVDAPSRTGKLTAPPQDAEKSQTPAAKLAGDAPGPAIDPATQSATVPQDVPKSASPAAQTSVAGKANIGDASPKRSGGRGPGIAAKADQQPATPSCAQAPAATAAIANSVPGAGQQAAPEPDVVTAMTEGGPRLTPAGGRSTEPGPAEPATSSEKVILGQDTPATAPVAAEAAPTQMANLVPGTSFADLSPQPATSAGTAPPQSAEPAQSASPAEQVAPALVRIGHASDGTQRLTVRLQPPELGQVEVRIDRSHESPARVEITVEKQETLTLLLRDQPQLQRALDQAGVPAEGRTVTFHVAAAEQSARGEPATAPAPGVAAGGPSSDGSHGPPRNGGQTAQRQADTADSTTPESIPVGLSGWIRGGLDITA